MGLFDKMLAAARLTRSDNQTANSASMHSNKNTNRCSTQPINSKYSSRTFMCRRTSFSSKPQPSEDAKANSGTKSSWVNPRADDITADINVDTSRAMSAAAGGGGQSGETYTVKAGDNLSKISKQFYGDANEYMRIFYANRDKLRDPDKIQVG